ncbi:hypothetical protein TNCV_4122241 [Trichonephila clavipes]|nr:hypothetical protein TNCV_4122241 [Trichonephila clavipes]
MKIRNNGNLILGPFDESTPCLMIVLMNCQTKLRIHDLTAVKSVAILETTRGLLATDYVILNHGQVTWTTPELAPLSLTTTPTGRTLQLSTDITCFHAVHGRSLVVLGSELVTRPATIGTLTTQLQWPPYSLELRYYSYIVVVIVGVVWQLGEGGASSGVVRHLTMVQNYVDPRQKPRAAEQCVVNIQSINQLNEFDD